MVFFFFTLRTLSFQWPWGSDCSWRRGARWTRGRQWGWMGASRTSQQIISHSTGWLCSDPNYGYFWWSYKVYYLFVEVVEAIGCFAFTFNIFLCFAFCIFHHYWIVGWKRLLHSLFRPGEVNILPWSICYARESSEDGTQWSKDWSMIKWFYDLL